jgi:hypothetical protein
MWQVHLLSQSFDLSLFQAISSSTYSSQHRYFKLATHESFDPLHPHLHKLYWYSRKGSASLNSLSVERVRTISVVACPRRLVYHSPSRTLSLATETLSVTDDIVYVVCTGVETVSSKTRLLLAPSSDLSVFSVLLDDGSELQLRSAKIDRVVRWINVLALVGSFIYCVLNIC